MVKEGTTLTEAVRCALQERLSSIQVAPPSSENTEKVYRDLKAIADRFAKLPVLDDLTIEEIIGYDEHGLPR